MKTAEEMIREVVEMCDRICKSYDDMIQESNEFFKDTKHLEYCTWALQESASNLSEATILLGAI